jgi:hypothetical protein
MEISIWVITGTVATLIGTIAAVITLFIKNKKMKNNSNSENQNMAEINQTTNAPYTTPVTFGANSDNPTIIINNNEKNNNENAIRLTPMALEILQEISKCNFRELGIFLNQCNFWYINANGRKFGDSNIDENIVAKSAVDELIRYNFINKTSEHKYQLNQNGINYLKNIS